jgi:hypothetical protein
MSIALDVAEGTKTQAHAQYKLAWPKNNTDKYHFHY